MHALAEKLFRKFQQISETAMESFFNFFFFQKRFISTTGECALKKNSAIFVFLYCDINKLNQSMEVSFFSMWVFFHNHSRVTGLQGKVGGISLNRHYHFHPLHRNLDISRAITAESSPLHTGSSWNGNSFSIHRSEEIFALSNDLMICKYICYKCLRKGTVVQYSDIM